MTGAPTDVVIGAGSGMGTAVAERLAGSLHRLLVVDMNGEAVSALAQRLPGDVAAASCDITDPDAVSRLVAEAGPLGRLIVTAGVSPSMGDARTIFEVDLVAMEHLLHSFEPSVVDGTVAVVFASMAGHQVPADPAVDALIDDPSSPSMFDGLSELGLLDDSGIAYAIAKRGVMRLVERRALAWGRAGGRLLSLSPGIIDTPMGRLEDRNQPVMADMVTRSALGREGTAEEVAAVAVFLASDAASYLTGTDVLVDGGAVAAFRHG